MPNTTQFSYFERGLQIAIARIAHSLAGWQDRVTVRSSDCLNFSSDMSFALEMREVGKVGHAMVAFTSVQACKRLGKHEAEGRLAGSGG